MRRSRYTVQAAGQAGEHLLYHTATGAFAVLGEDAWEDFCSCSGPYAQQLAEAGFITDLSAHDELALQQERFDAVRSNHQTLTLSFVPTYACNFRCPYCYEQGHNSIKGKMDARMMDAVCSFVSMRHAADGFSSLSVQWYGGDPSLALDVVEELSARLCAFCDERGIAYDAMMITNANIIDEAAAHLMAAARIGSVMLTIDGPEELHNVRRVAADGSNSYQKNIQAARHLRAAGIEVFATMNVDKVSWPLYPQMREKLMAEEGISLSPGKLCDYGGCFGQGAFSKPSFDLFTHEEFAQARLERYEAEGHSAAETRHMLAPIERFCTGQLDNYFVIDLLGDVYNCDGRVGDKAYVRFNITDDPSTWLLEDVSHDPTRDEKCSQCELLPICLGSCIWERSCSGWPCHPFKYTIDGYLRLWRESFGELEAGYTRLA